MKSLVDKSPFEPILDNCPHMSNMCVVLEHILSHRIQGMYVCIHLVHLFFAQYNIQKCYVTTYMLMLHDDINL